MTDDTLPIPEQPAGSGGGSAEPPPPRNTTQARIFGWVSVGLFLAVGIGAFALSQWDGSDSRPVATTTTVADQTAASSTTAESGNDTPTTTSASDDEEITGQPSLFLSENADGTTTLRGFIPSGAVAERLLAAAESAYGEANVIDETTVGTGSEPEWMRELARIIRYLDRVDGATLDAQFTTEGTLVIAGQVANERDRTRTLERFGEAMPEFTVEDQLEVGGSGGRDRNTEDADARRALRAATDQIVDANVLFATASADISEEGAAFLDEIADILDEYPTVQIQIEGHTDSQGSEADNEALSQARADSVLAYLVAAGIAEERLEAVGYGERRPLGDNETDAGRAENRRIEFTVTDR